jgi:hypothetical protein
MKKRDVRFWNSTADVKELEFREQFAKLPEQEQERLVHQAIDELVRQGKVYDTGLRRDGKILYTAVPDAKSKDAKSQ